MDILKSGFFSLYRTALQEKSEPLRGAGYVIPPELFSNILRFVSRDDSRPQIFERIELERRSKSYNRSRDEMRWDFELLQAAPVYTLRNCSLVSSYWANQCRRYMFTGRTLKIKTLEHAETFREYATQGSPRLIRICDLIQSLEVTQSLTETRSMVNLVYLPSTHDKLASLYIAGPLVARSQAKLFSPHWGQPAVAAIPYAVTSYKEVSLVYLQFPSSWHVARYTAHFHAASSFTFLSLHWDGKVTTPLPKFLHSDTSKKISVRVSRCTDNLLLCWQTAMMYGHFALHDVPSRDQLWARSIMKIITDLYDHIPGGRSSKDVTYFLYTEPRKPEQKTSFVFGVETTNGEDPAINFRFICDSQIVTKSGIAGRSSPIPVRIVGLIIAMTGTHDSAHLPTVDLSVVRKEIAKCCALRIVVFVFHDYAMMEALVQQYPNLREPPSNGSTYLFVHPRSRLNSQETIGRGEFASLVAWIVINPVTMDETGEQWDQWSDFISAHV